MSPKLFALATTSLLLEIALAVWLALFHICYYDARALAVAVGTSSPGEHTIVLVGDVMTWDATAQAITRYGALYPFQATLPLLREADLTVANLEGPVADRAPRIPRRWSYRVPTWTLVGLASAGFDAVSLANNHLADCGADGIVETIAGLRGAGIATFGGGANEHDARALHIERVGETRVALIGLVTADSLLHDEHAASQPGAYQQALEGCRQRLEATANRAGAVVATPDIARALVREARQRADVVIAFVHWGVRYRRAPSALQLELGRALVDAGADLIVGHHAHTWQPVALSGKTPIVYGTGNFAFGSRNWFAEEALLVRAVLRQRKIDRLELFPLAVRNVNPLVAYQPKVMKGPSAYRLLTQLRADSRGFGAQLQLRDDRAVLQLPH